MRQQLLLVTSLSITTVFVYFSYRHTEEMIHKLESAGLGYHVATQQTRDRFGKTSYRCGSWNASMEIHLLVYVYYILIVALVNKTVMIRLQVAFLFIIWCTECILCQQACVL